MRLALIRHPALRVAPGICYGRRDFPIADPAEIDDIVARLGAFRPAVVIASPAGRCRLLAEAIGCSHLTFDDRLLELDFGDWEGLPWDAIDRIAFDAWAADAVGRAPPGGETGAALIDRGNAVFDEVVATGRDHAIVTHGGPLKILTCRASGNPIDLMAPSPPTGSLCIFSYETK